MRAFLAGALVGALVTLLSTAGLILMDAGLRAEGEK